MAEIMILKIITRRTASRVVPCASRIKYHHHLRRNISTLFSPTNGGAANKNIVHGVYPSALQRFSTTPKPDKSLIKIIEAEVQCLVESSDRDMLAGEARDCFPFEIEENPARETMILRREFKGEKISVEVYMPNLLADFGDIPLTVRVFKKSGVFLEFAACVDDSGDIAIGSLTVKDPKVEDDPYASAPAFRDLDYNLQNAFHMYLERRKITPRIIKFLQDYVVDKDTKEYSHWFHTVKHFVKSDSEFFSQVEDYIQEKDSKEYMNWLHDIKKFVKSDSG